MYPVTHSRYSARCNSNPYSRPSMRYDCNWPPFTGHSSRRSLIRCPQANRFKRNLACHNSWAAALTKYADLIHFLELDTQNLSKKFLPSCHVQRGRAFLFALLLCGGVWCGGGVVFPVLCSLCVCSLCVFAVCARCVRALCVFAVCLMVFV